MEKNTKLIDCVAPVELNLFLENIMEQIGEKDPVKAVEMINSKRIILTNVKEGWLQKESWVDATLFSDGTTGPQWIARLTSKGIFLDSDARRILSSENFMVTSGETIKLSILCGLKIGLFDNYLFEYAAEHDLKKLKNSIEAACLFREKFSNKQVSLMGFSEVVFDVGDFYFSIKSGGQNWLQAFKKRNDNYFAHVFSSK